MLAANRSSYLACIRLHYLADLWPSHLQGREKAEEHAGEYSKADTKEQDRHIDVEVRLMGERVFGQAGHDPPQALIGKQHPEARAGNSQDERFGQKLADEPKTAGA